MRAKVDAFWVRFDGYLRSGDRSSAEAALAQVASELPAHDAARAQRELVAQRRAADASSAAAAPAFRFARTSAPSADARAHRAPASADALAQESDGRTAPAAGPHEVADLDGQTVVLRGDRPTLTLRGLRRCVVVLAAGRVEGAVAARDCAGCTVAAACGQLRASRCSGCAFFVHVRSAPAFEACSDCALGPLECLPREIAGVDAAAVEEAARAAAGEPDASNRWRDAVDFDHPAGVSPNVRLAPP